jgi:cytoskeletal protein RodZ
MALSMDEQRVLAEIERRLAADDPGLATCLTSFRRPGPATVLRSPRARIMGSLFTVLLVTMVSLMVYAMVPFRVHGARTPATPSTSTHGAVTSAAAGASLSSRTTPPASANASAGATAAARSSGKSATPSAGASASTKSTRGAKSQVAPTATGPLARAAKDSRQSWTR